MFVLSSRNTAFLGIELGMFGMFKAPTIEGRSVTQERWMYIHYG